MNIYREFMRLAYKVPNKMNDFLAKDFRSSSYDRCIIIEEKKVIYVPIPKVMCTSLKEFCYQLSGREVAPIEDSSIHSLPFKTVTKQCMAHFYKDYFSFAFVRNPWDRIVSCYRDKIVRYRKEQRIFEKFMQYKDMDVGMSFNDFVNFIYRTEDRKSEEHFKSQVCFINDGDGRRIVQFIGKIETVEEDMKELMKSINVSGIELKKRKLSNVGGEDYRNYYNKITKDLIYKRYYQDIKEFDYEF